MLKNLFFVLFILLFSTNASAYVWSSAIPKEVHIVPDGLVLLGEFDNTGINCVTGPKAIYLSNIDLNFDAKLSLALTAKAAGKKIRVLLSDTEEGNCIEINAMGFVPIVHNYYWQLKD